MPYKSPKELPQKIRAALPEHAQHIYIKAYNNAAEEYADPKKRRGKDKLKVSGDIAAYKVAWAAVKKKYKKETETGNWVEKS